MTTRITPFNRWFYIIKTMWKIRLADRCVASNKKSIDRYLIPSTGNLTKEQSDGLDACLSNVNIASKLKEKWTWLLHRLEENEVYSLEE